jgi:hypothetical protein
MQLTVVSEVAHRILLEYGLVTLDPVEYPAIQNEVAAIDPGAVSLGFFLEGLDMGTP